MIVGDEVKLLGGKDRGEVGTIIYAYPGKGGGYYFRVTLWNGKVLERVATGLKKLDRANSQPQT